MYNACEDSFLIKRHIQEFCKPGSLVLDMGTGSGILAFEAASKTRGVTAVDIDQEIISELRDKSGADITFIQSDLFLKIPKKIKFDLVIFNPPYLPSKKIKYVDIDGGKNGTEIIEKFLKQARTYLKKDGKILLLTSSLNKNIEKLFKKNKYHYLRIDEEKFFFEKLFLWVLSFD